MKAFEIITPQYSVRKITGTADKFRHNMGVPPLGYVGIKSQPKSKLVTVLGHGVYSTVVEIQGRPEVLKISRGCEDVNDDPYYQYISLITSGDYVAKNPYFPRVYKVKVYETQDKIAKQFYIVYMEKLFHLETLSNEELIGIVARVVQPKLSSRIRAAITGYEPTAKLYKMTDEKLREVLVDSTRNFALKDTLFKQAMNFTLNFNKEHDITERNIMVRRTSTGSQLVLADPLSD